MHHSDTQIRGAVLALLLIMAAGLVGITAAWGLPAPQPVDPTTGFTVDAMKMVGACKEGARIYWAPDGRYWTWRGAWAPVTGRDNTSC